MKLTYEDCKIEALKYNTRKELNINNSIIYNKIKNKKWYDLYIHMETQNSWSYEDCRIEALKYNTRKELKNNNSTIYSKIKDKRWLELFNHMKRNSIWTYEKCKIEALKYSTKKEMGLNNKLLYSVIRKNKWYELCNHMNIIGNMYKRLIYVYEFNDKSCYVGLTGNIEIRNKQHFSNKDRRSNCIGRINFK